MSLSFIHQFQRRLYQLLSSNNTLRQRVSGIYLSVVQDSRYPFLVIDLRQANDLSRYDTSIYEIDLAIHAFARGQNNQEFLLSLTDAISDCLTPQACQFDQYLVAGLTLTNITFEQASDLLSSKATMSYKALLKGGNK